MQIYSVLVLFLSTSSILLAEVNQDGKGASARSTEVSVGCFAADSTVELSSRRTINVGQLNTGDSLLTLQGKDLTTTEMIFMLDKNKHEQIVFYTVRTISGHEISLTGEHLIATIQTQNNKTNFVFASKLKVEDRIVVMIDGQPEPSSIVSIERETKRGYFAPLTVSGTLLVNGVLVSSFCSVSNHDRTQFFLFPIRVYYRLTHRILGLNSFDEQRDDGIHWLIDLLYRLLIFLRRHSIVESL